MVSGILDFRERRAPYAPISSLEKFFQRIRDRSVPERVDQAFLKRLGVASNNEYALLSALKFLGVVDHRGRATDAYRSLQSADTFRPALERLIREAYRQVFEVGAESWAVEEQIEWFRAHSSPSQAKNAARFFRAVCGLAGMPDLPSPVREPSMERPAGGVQVNGEAERTHDGTETWRPEPVKTGQPTMGIDIASVKAHLLAKLPAARAEWSATEYRAICDRFVEMLRSLDESR